MPAAAVQATAVPEFRRKPVDVRQRTPSPSSRGSPTKETPRERFKDAKEKFLMLEKERMDEQRSALRKCMELRQRRDNGAVQAQVIRAAVRGDPRGDWPKGYGSDDETDSRDYGRYDDRYDDDGEDDDDRDEDDDRRRRVHRDYGGFDGKRQRNVVRGSDRSRESLQDDRDYRNDGYPKPRRSRNPQVYNIKTHLAKKGRIESLFY